MDVGPVGIGVGVTVGAAVAVLRRCRCPRARRRVRLVRRVRGRGWRGRRRRRGAAGRRRRLEREALQVPAAAGIRSRLRVDLDLVGHDVAHGHRVLEARHRAPEDPVVAKGRGLEDLDGDLGVARIVREPGKAEPAEPVADRDGLRRRGRPVARVLRVDRDLEGMGRQQAQGRLRRDGDRLFRAGVLGIQPDRVRAGLAPGVRRGGGRGRGAVAEVPAPRGRGPRGRVAQADRLPGHGVGRVHLEGHRR